MAEAVIHFGGEAEYLTLTVYAWNLPDNADFWDGNWLSCTAEVRAGAFRGSVDGQIRKEELGIFLSQVESLYQRLDGESSFQTMENWLELQLIGDGRGHIVVRGRLRENQSQGNTLEFRLFFDQTYLPKIREQLREAVEAFPVVGQR